MSFRARDWRLPGAAALVLIAALTTALQTAPATAAPFTGKADWMLGGQPCALIPVPTAAPLGISSCPGVRPGATVQTDKGMCTFNFMFVGTEPDGTKTRYMGTAGHCILLDAETGSLPSLAVPHDLEETYAEGEGPVARDASGERIGEFAYAVLSDPKDFALIRLDDDVQASPQMCHFGGPTGINDDMPSVTEPVLLHQYGQGVGVGTVLPARSMIALGMPDPDHVYAEGAVVPGDSGSGVISSDGRAVGVATTSGVHAAGVGSEGLDAGTVGITRLTPQLERAEEMLDTDLQLVTAPLR